MTNDWNAAQKPCRSAALRHSAGQSRLIIIDASYSCSDLSGCRVSVYDDANAGTFTAVAVIDIGRSSRDPRRPTRSDGPAEITGLGR
jgi:hypothetical protein